MLEQLFSIVIYVGIGFRNPLDNDYRCFKRAIAFKAHGLTLKQCNDTFTAFQQANDVPHVLFEAKISAYL